MTEMHLLTSGRGVRAWLLVLLLTAFALRVYHLAASGFWFDEAASYFIASKGWIGLIEYARTAPGEHPPLYYLPLVVWMNWAGAGEFAMRFFSVWFGVLFIALFYRFARHHFDHRLALLATMFSVPLPFLVDYSQEARMYTMILCPTVLAMDYFLRWARGEPRVALKYLLCLLIALSIHYYAILLMAALDVYVLSRRELWRSLGRPILLFHIIVAALLGLWLYNASGPVVSASRAFTNPLFAGRGPDELSRIAVDLTVGGVLIRNITAAEYMLAASMWLVILIGIVWAHRHFDRLTRGLPLREWLFALMIVPPLLAAIVPYVYAARYLFVTIPALLLLLGCGLMALHAAGRWSLVVGIAALLLTFSAGVYLNYHFVKSAYREMAAQITNEARAEDGLILNGTGQWPLVLYYLHGAWARNYIPPSSDAAELVDIDPAMHAVQQAHATLWVIGEQTTVVDPGDNVARWLSLHAYPLSRQWFKFDQSVARALSDRPLLPYRRWDYHFGEWLMLEQSAISTQSVAAGDGVAIHLVWHALKPIPQPQQLLMTLRLFDQHGRVVAERVSKPCDGFCPIDDWVVGTAVDDRHGLLVPRDASAGEYVLRLEVYAPRQQQSLLIKGAQGELGASLELSRIVVQSPLTSAQR